MSGHRHTFLVLLVERVPKSNDLIPCPPKRNWRSLENRLIPGLERLLVQIGKDELRGGWGHIQETGATVMGLPLTTNSGAV